MPPADGSLSAPGQGPVRSALSRMRRSYDAAPLPVKVLIVVACCIVCVPFAAFGILAGLIFAPYAVWGGRRDGWATASVALWGVVLVATQVHGESAPHYALLARARDRGSGGPCGHPRPVVRAMPHRRLGAADRVAARNRRVPAGRQGPLAVRARPGVAARGGRARLAAGQGLAGQPPERARAAGSRRRSGRGYRLERRPGGAAEPRRPGQRAGGPGARPGRSGRSAARSAARGRPPGGRS